MSVGGLVFVVSDAGRIAATRRSPRTASARYWTGMQDVVPILDAFEAAQNDAALQRG
jgi:hypothetical protein